MTVPPPPGPSNGEPPPGDAGWQQPGAWQQQPDPQYQQPQYQQPGAWQQQPDPQYQQPQYQQPDPQYQQPYNQQPYGQSPYGQQPQTPGQRPPKRHGKLIGVTAAVIVLAGGGIATYVAVSDSSSDNGGAASPTAAVSSIVNDLNKSDLIGALDDLAPGERTALAGPARAQIEQLKRLKILSSGADAGHFSGITFNLKGLSFADKTIKINDHAAVVQVTGGSLDVSSDAAKFPFSKQFLDAAFPNGMPARSSSTQHVDVGQVIKNQRDGRPIRIATQRVDGRWYPSVFYTIADHAAHNAVPDPSSAVPAKGAGSAEEAVKKEVQALLSGDLQTAIALTSPVELAALHDYAGLLLPSGGAAYDSTDVTIKTLDLTTSKISDGGVRVGLKKLVIANADGEQISIALANNCLDLTASGKSQHLCAKDLVQQAASALGRFGVSSDIPAGVQQAFTHIIEGLMDVGIDTSQTDGEWYVNPVRTMNDISVTVLKSMHDNDIMTLINFFSKLNN